MKKTIIKRLLPVVGVLLLHFALSWVIAVYILKIQWSLWTFIKDPTTIAFWGTIILFETISILWIWFRERKKSDKEK